MICNVRFIVKSESVFKVAGSHVYFRSGSISKMVLDSDVVQEALTGSDIRPKSSNCDDLGCIYFKVICRLQSF